MPAPQTKYTINLNKEIIIMKIKIDEMVKITNKVMAAVGKEDTIKIEFKRGKAKDGSAMNIVQFLANSGNGFQISQNMKYDGEPLPSSAKYVKASALATILKNYQTLGVESVGFEPTDSQLIVKNDMGQAGLGATEKNPGEISKEKGQKNPLITLKFNLKELQAAVRSVAYALKNDVAAKMQGIYFAANDTGYTLYGLNRFFCAQSKVKCGFGKPNTDKPFSKDFMVPANILKALAVMEGDSNGSIDGLISQNYLLLRDGKLANSYIQLMETKEYPKEGMVGRLTEKNEPLANPELFSAKENKSLIEASCNLADLLNNNHIVKLSAVKLGSNTELVTGSDQNPQTISASEVNFKADGTEAHMCFTTQLLLNILSNISEENIFIRVGSSKCILIYSGDDIVPSAFLLGRSDENQNKTDKESDEKK